MATRQRRTIADAFDRRHNGLSSIRLVFASAVILWHSFPLTGHEIHPEALQDFLSSFRADGFFAISGFLILASWLRYPDVPGYLRARLLRVLPGYWVSLVVVSLVLAPGAVLLSGGNAGSLFSGEHNSWQFLIQNSTTHIRMWDIASTPGGVANPEVWNGSIWTLQYELAAYAGLLSLGILGLARRSGVLLALAVTAWLLMLVRVLELAPWMPGSTVRFAYMFLIGACLYAYRERIPVSGWWPLLAVAGLVAGVFLPEYRLTGGPALAYLVIWIGSRMRHPRWKRTQDMSYGLFLYGYPIQQAMLVLGWPWHNPGVFFIASWLATLPLAAGSWFLIERPAMRWKRRLDQRTAEPVSSVAQPAHRSLPFPGAGGRTAA